MSACQKDEEERGMPAKINNDRAGGTSSSDASGNPPAIYYIDESFKPVIDGLANEGFADARSGEAGFLLERVSRYHLEPYLRVAREIAAPKSPTIKMAYNLLVFDRRCQSLVLEFIGVFETQLRAQYAHWMAEEGGQFAIYDPSLFIDAAKYSTSLGLVESEVKRKVRKNIAVKRSLVNEKAPINVAVECMTMGTLSKLYANTKHSDNTKRVAESFGQPKRVLVNWTKTINAARNCFAHFDCYFFKKQIPSSPLAIEGAVMNRNSPMYLVLILEKLLSSPLIFSDILLHYSARLSVDIIREIQLISESIPEVIQCLKLDEGWRDELRQPDIVGAESMKFMMLDENGVRESGTVVMPNRCERIDVMLGRPFD